MKNDLLNALRRWINFLIKVKDTYVSELIYKGPRIHSDRNNSDSTSTENNAIETLSGLIDSSREVFRLEDNLDMTNQNDFFKYKLRVW